MPWFITWTNGSQFPHGNTLRTLRASVWVKSLSDRIALRMARWSPSPSCCRGPRSGLGRDPNGDWLGRKTIPTAVRAAYAAAFNCAKEERLRLPGSLPSERAWREFAIWEQRVSAQIEQVRTIIGSAGHRLTHREVQSLVEEWSVWFFARPRDYDSATDVSAFLRDAGVSLAEDGLTRFHDAVEARLAKVESASTAQGLSKRSHGFSGNPA